MWSQLTYLIFPPSPFHLSLGTSNIPRFSFWILTNTCPPGNVFWAITSFEALSNCHREGNGTPLQYFCLENPMEGGAWWAAVHGVAEGQTQLSNFTFTFHFHALEKEMATHSSVLAWRVPGMAEPGGLLSMGLCRVGHDWSNLAAEAANCQSRGD